jgi:type IV pilus assembly protein PilO
MADKNALDPLLRLSIQGQLGVSALIGALVLGGFWYFWWNPKTEEQVAKQQQLATLQQEIRKLEAAAAKLDQFKAEVALLEARLERLRQVLPSEKQTADLMRKVQSMASESSLAVRAFNPGATVSQEFYEEWPISVVVNGTYHNLGMFFDRVSRLSRLVNISNVKITSQRTPTAINTISATCTATTYVFIDTPPQGATTQ